MTFPRELLKNVAFLLGRLVILTAVGVTPWLFGGVQASVQVWLFLALGVALLCSLVTLATHLPADRSVPAVMVPLVGALVLGCIQLLPLTPAMLEAVAPHTAALRSSLASELSGLHAASELAVGAIHPSISLYPASTRHDLAILVLATGMFLAGAYLFRTAGSQVCLLGVLAVNGAALALFGVFQMRQWDGKLYGLVPLSGGGAPFGPFVCRNNAGGFLCLCLATAVGLVVWSFAKQARQAARPQVSRTWSTALRRLLTQTLPWLGGLFAALAVAGCVVAGIVCGLSRGGWVAMAGGAVATGMVVGMVRRRLLWFVLFAAIPIVGVVVVLWMEVDERVSTRLSTLSDWQTLSQNRIPHWRDSVQAVTDFWPTGSGLGTYRYVYKSYETRPADVFFYHAENQYLEALIEGGVVGLALLLAAIVLVGAAAGRLLRADPATAFALGVAGTFALLAQTIHSCLDFGLYLPANMLTFALICGAVCGGSLVQRGDREPPPTPSGDSARRSRRLQASVILHVGLVAAIVWGGVEMQRFAMREAALASVPSNPEPANASAAEAEMRLALDRVERAIKVRPDDAELRLAAAKLWAVRYRLASLAALRSAAICGASTELVWEDTALGRLRSKAHGLYRSDSMGELAALRRQPLVQQYLMPAWKHLLSARDACPLSANTHLRIAELAWLVESPENDTVPIERACRLVPCYPDLWLRAGLLDYQAGRIEAAWTKWRHCLALSTRHLATIFSLAESHAGPMEIAGKLLPDSVPLLVRVAEEKYSGLEFMPVRDLLGQRIESILPEAKLDEAEGLYYRGLARAMQNDSAGAVAHWARANEIRPDEARWHHELAVQLRKGGRLAEARREAQIAAQLEPSSPTYVRLLEEMDRALLEHSSE